jgi:hypothetical protein
MAFGLWLIVPYRYTSPASGPAERPVRTEQRREPLNRSISM